MAETSAAERGTLAGIIACSMLLAFAWVFAIPMFQAPDEDNHYDYALTLRTAGRPIGPAEGPPQNDTHPSLRHLLGAVNGISLRLDPMTRLPPGYGTQVFYREVDRTAPVIDAQRFHAGPISPVPYLTKTYPIGYYALAAVAIAAGDFVVPNSVVTQFFAARMLSVLLLGLTLFFSWLLLRELRVAPRIALAIVAITGLLPLSARTFSSVQPDTLVAALVPLALWLTLCATRAGLPPWSIAATGCVLAGLCATKQQTFAAVFVAVACSCFATALQRRASATKTAWTAAWLVLPSLAVYELGRPLTAWPPGGAALCAGSPGQGLAATLIAALHALPAEVLADGESALLGGEGMSRFWLSFGWHTDPIIVGSIEISRLLLELIAVGTIVVVFLALMALGRNVARLVAVARRKPLTAFALATRNVAVNAFTVYTTILVLVFAYAHGGLALQGRYWIPVLAIVFYFALCIAPTALRTLSRPFRDALCGSILAIIAVTNVFLVPSVHARYAAAPQALDPSTEVFGGFVLGSRDLKIADLGSVRRGEHLAIRGFAVDLRRVGPTSGNVLAIDGGAARVATQPASDPHLACKNVLLQISNAGLTAQVPTADLGPGQHTLRILARVPWSERAIDPGARGSFYVDP